VVKEVYAFKSRLSQQSGEPYLSPGGRFEVFAPNDMCYAKMEIIGYAGYLIGRYTIAATNYKVLHGRVQSRGFYSPGYIGVVE
jgi:hypothetical protein